MLASILHIFKPGTVYLFHSILKIAINAAVEEELLIRNRFTKVVIKFKLTKETYNYLTIEELNIFLHTAKSMKILRVILFVDSRLYRYAQR